MPAVHCSSNTIVPGATYFVTLPLSEFRRMRIEEYSHIEWRMADGRVEKIKLSRDEVEKKAREARL